MHTEVTVPPYSMTLLWPSQAELKALRDGRQRLLEQALDMKTGIAERDSRIAELQHQLARAQLAAQLAEVQLHECPAQTCRSLTYWRQQTYAHCDLSVSSMRRFQTLHVAMCRLRRQLLRPQWRSCGRPWRRPRRGRKRLLWWRT